MSLAQELRIGLTVDGGCVGEVALGSLGPPPSQSLFVGLQARAVPARAAMIFALCPVAQSFAAELAIGAALGEEVVLHRNRSIALTAEHIGENMRSLVLAWPGRAPDNATLSELRAALAALRGLADASEAEAPARFARLRAGAEALGIDLGHKPDTGWFGSLLLDIAADPALDIPLERDPYEILPTDYDAVFGAMARGVDLPPQAAPPPVSSAEHLRARKAAIAAAIDRIARLGAGDDDHSVRLSRSLGNRVGAAAVMSPRGPLFHVVGLDASHRVDFYRTLSPTDRNFASEGPFARSLRGRSIGSGPLAKRRVAQIAALYDPCVSIDLNIRERVHA